MPTAVNQFWLYSFPHCPDAKSGGSMFCQIGSHLEREVPQNAVWSRLGVQVGAEIPESAHT